MWWATERAQGVVPLWTPRPGYLTGSSGDAGAVARPGGWPDDTPGTGVPNFRGASVSAHCPGDHEIQPRWEVTQDLVRGSGRGCTRRIGTGRDQCRAGQLAEPPCLWMGGDAAGQGVVFPA